jgi:hypothetical protein
LVSRLVRGAKRLFLPVILGTTTLIVVVVPVVSPSSFEGTKDCRARLLCQSVWWTKSNGLNYAMVAFVASALTAFALGIWTGARGPGSVPMSLFKKYSHDVALWIAQANRSVADEATYRSRVSDLLETIAALARSLSGGGDEAKVHASLMIAEAPPSSRAEVRFLHRGRLVETYQAVLIVDAYSSSNLPLPYMRLPVDQGQHVLPGAPAAYARSNVLCIDDTLNIDWSEHQGIDEILRGDVQAYFREQKDVLRTMICIALRRGPEVLGVLNIDSPTPELFRDSAKHVADIVEPYLALLLPLVDHRRKAGYPYASG